MAWDGRFRGERCSVRRILGRREGYVHELSRIIRGRVSAMERAWRRMSLEQQLKASRRRGFTTGFGIVVNWQSGTRYLLCSM
jgi:hypothetical protein